MKTKGKRPGISRTKPKGKKPPAKDSMAAEVPRKLGDKELYYGARRLVTKVQLVKSLRARKKSQSATINGEIKQAEAEVDVLVEQLATGVEMVEKGDLFAGEQPGAAKEPESAPATPSQDQATAALAKVEESTSPAAQFVASLGERNGMSPREIKSRLWQWCGKKIRSREEREALWDEIKALVEKQKGEQASAGDGA